MLFRSNESTGGGNAPDLMSIASQLLDSNAPGGGLAGLVQHFEQGGLGEVIGSWISNGQNLPISADQLQSALGGHPALAGLLQQAQGPQGQALLGQLAQIITPAFASSDAKPLKVMLPTVKVSDDPQSESGRSCSSPTRKRSG